MQHTEFMTRAGDESDSSLLRLQIHRGGAISKRDWKLMCVVIHCTAPEQGPRADKLMGWCGEIVNRFGRHEMSWLERAAFRLML